MSWPKRLIFSVVTLLASSQFSLSQQAINGFVQNNQIQTPSFNQINPVDVGAHNHNKFHGATSLNTTGVSPNGNALTITSTWNNTPSNVAPDFDNHVLLPAGNGAYNGQGSQYTRPDQPFDASGELARRIDTGQYQIGFGSGAIARLNQEIGGVATVPNPTPCLYSAGNCEEVRISGNLPASGTYSQTLHNFNQFVLPNPSAAFQTQINTEGSVGVLEVRENGQVVQPDHLGNYRFDGTLTNTGDLSSRLDIDTFNLGFAGHANGVKVVELGGVRAKLPLLDMQTAMMAYLRQSTMWNSQFRFEKTNLAQAGFAKDIVSLLDSATYLAANRNNRKIIDNENTRVFLRNFVDVALPNSTQRGQTNLLNKADKFVSPIANILNAGVSIAALTNAYADYDGNKRVVSSIEIAVAAGNLTSSVPFALPVVSARIGTAASLLDTNTKDFIKFKEGDGWDKAEAASFAVTKNALTAAGYLAAGPVGANAGATAADLSRVGVEFVAKTQFFDNAIARFFIAGTWLLTGGKRVEDQHQYFLRKSLE
jgi:hypothetical protein